jgi:AcrR family transcriptional regulator
MLNMRSIAPDDATTRSRIRDTAITLFGRQGFASTTIRAIAEQAGVSPGLVIHHFGSKDALRLACDEHVVQTVLGDSAGRAPAEIAAQIGHRLSDFDTYRVSLDYMSRMLTEGSVSGDHLFDQLTDGTEDYLAAGEADGSILPSSDRRMLAALLAAFGLATLVFERHIGRVIGEPGLTKAALQRLVIPSLEYSTNGIFANDDTLVAAREAMTNIAPKNTDERGTP